MFKSFYKYIRNIFRLDRFITKAYPDRKTIIGSYWATFPSLHNRFTLMIYQIICSTLRSEKLQKKFVYVPYSTDHNYKILGCVMFTFFANGLGVVKNRKDKNLEACNVILRYINENHEHLPLYMSRRWHVKDVSIKKINLEREELPYISEHLPQINFLHAHRHLWYNRTVRLFIPLRKLELDTFYFTNNPHGLYYLHERRMLMSRYLDDQRGATVFRSTAFEDMQCIPKYYDDSAYTMYPDCWRVCAYFGYQGESIPQAWCCLMRTSSNLKKLYTFGVMNSYGVGNLGIFLCKSGSDWDISKKIIK